MRAIHLNANAVAPAENTLFGFRAAASRRTLVIETDHIKPGYFDHEGTPMSDQIKVVERLDAERRLHGSTTSSRRRIQ